MILKEFTIQAISKGSDDVGKVHMQVEYDGHEYYGFGANTDIVAASVEAYIDCSINSVNKPITYGQIPYCTYFTYGKYIIRQNMGRTYSNRSY